MLSFDAKGFDDAFSDVLALVVATDGVADHGVNDAEASGQLLLGDILLYHCNPHFFPEWDAWDSSCHGGLLLSFSWLLYLCFVIILVFRYCTYALLFCYGSEGGYYREGDSVCPAALDDFV